MGESKIICGFSTEWGGSNVPNLRVVQVSAPCKMSQWQKARKCSAHTHTNRSTPMELGVILQYSNTESLCCVNIPEANLML